MNHPLRTLVCAASIPLLASSLTAQTQTILNETWASGSRTTQDLPNSARWFTSDVSSTLTAEVGKMTSTATNTRYALAYFTSPVGDAAPVPVSVDVGKTLTIAYSYSFSDLPTTGTPWMRIGVFNSTTSTNSSKRITGDNAGTSASAYAGYTGYMFDEINVRTGGNVTLRRRTGTGNNLMTTSNQYTSPIGTSVSGIAYTDNAIYNAVMTISHGINDEGKNIVTLTQNVYDTTEKKNLLYSRTATDIDGVWQFDTIAFAITASAGPFTLYNMNISLGDTPIPEPSTYAAIGAGVCLLLCVAVRRRRKVAA